MLAYPGKNIKISLAAYEIMMQFASDNPRHEVLGVIFGQVNPIGDSFITEAFPFRVGRRTQVKFEDQDYELVVPLIKECETKGLSWLGWFHSHPFKRGDHLYMSNVDVSYQIPAQQLNPFWTAIVLNPHQKKDPKTVRGARAFRMASGENGEISSHKVVELSLSISN